MEEDGRFEFQSFREVVPRQKLGDGHFAAELQDVGKRHFREPIAVADDLGPRKVEHAAQLAEISGGVLFDAFGREAGPRRVAAAGIADSGRVIADNNDRLVSQLLELANLSHGDRVPQVHVNAGRVDPILDP